MRKARLMPAVLAAAIATSCSEGLLTDISRSLDDPVVVAPSAASFIHENRIDVTWPRDRGADEYVLERATDAAVPVYAVVSRGTSTNYVDTDCADQGRFLFRLTKIRGTKSFGPSAAVLGVSSAVCRDSLEPNDDESQGTTLTSTLAANLFYYSSILQQHGAALVEQDVDWFTLTVPPDRTANIVVTQQGLQGGSTNTWMYFYLKGTNPQQIVNNQAIPVTNYSNLTATFLFKIYPIPSSFAVNGGGSLINYAVSLNSITSN